MTHTLLAVGHTADNDWRHSQLTGGIPLPDTFPPRCVSRDLTEAGIRSYDLPRATLDVEGILADFPELTTGEAITVWLLRRDKPVPVAEQAIESIRGRHPQGTPRLSRVAA